MKYYSHDNNESYFTIEELFKTFSENYAAVE